MLRRARLALLAAGILPAQAPFVFDAHVHMINRQFYLGGDIGQRLPDGHVDLPRLKAGGFHALFFSLFVQEQYYPGRHETRHTLRLLDLARRQLAANSHAIELAYNAQDIRRINAQGKLAAVLDLEGGFDLDGDLGVLRELHRAGFRVLQLPAHNWANHFAASCCAKGPFAGLNDHGRKVVAEMNRLGILINVSHSSDQTIRDVLAVSTRPIAATHHGLKKFNDIPRTMSDDLLKAIAAKGGVVGFQAGCEFHHRPMFDFRTAQTGKNFWDTTDVESRVAKLSITDIDALVKPTYPMVGLNHPDNVRCTIDQWLAPVEYAIQIAGEDHVAFGSDYDGGPTLPHTMKDAADLPKLVAAMRRRGWSASRIDKFMGRNLLRVFDQATSTQITRPARAGK
jgi:membrane dipeptidase